MRILISSPAWRGSTTSCKEVTAKAIRARGRSPRAHVMRPARSLVPMLCVGTYRSDALRPRSVGREVPAQRVLLADSCHAPRPFSRSHALRGNASVGRSASSPIGFPALHFSAAPALSQAAEKWCWRRSINPSQATQASLPPDHREMGWSPSTGSSLGPPGCDTQISLSRRPPGRGFFEALHFCGIAVQTTDGRSVIH